MRGTYTHNNLDFSNDVLHMADLGFDQISVEPVVSLPDEPYAIKEEDIPVLLEQYDILAKEMIKRHKEGRGFNFFHFMIDLEGGPCVAKRLSGCGSGTEYMAVTPWGDLYPCHQFVGEDDFCIGNVFDGIKNQYMQKISVKTVLQDSTAVADAQQTDIMPIRISEAIMKSDASSRGSVWSAPS